MSGGQEAGYFKGQGKGMTWFDPCRPGCTPAEPCKAVGVCPVWREPLRSDLAKADNVARYHRSRERREARAWRSQQWEPSLTGAGGMACGLWMAK